MKVPEKSGENTDIKNITEYRSKRKRNKQIKILVIIGVILLAVILVFINRDTIFEPLRGIFSKINNTTDQSEGYPIDLPESSDYRLKPFSEGFVLLTDTYLYTYHMSGKQSFALQHGYIKPECITNSKRVLIYDKGGHNFALYSKTSEIYKQSIENEVIVSAFVSDHEYVAVVTSGGQYSNVVYLYDRNGKLRHSYFYLDEKVMQVAFSPDDNYVYVTLAKSDNGNIVTKIVKYSPEKEEKWSSEISDSVSVSLSVTNEFVTVVCDNKICSFDSESGALNGTYEYAGPLEDFAVMNDANVFLFGNYSDRLHTVVVLDKKCLVTASSKISESVKDISYDNQVVYLLTERGLISYDMSLQKQKENLFEDEYISFVKIGSDVLLIDGNKIGLEKV